MAITKSAWNGLITDTSATAVEELGVQREIVDRVRGSMVYRYVQNGEAATAFTAGNVIQRKTATNSTGVGIISASTDSYAGIILGVAVSAIKAGEYGWVQIKGWNDKLVTDGGTTSLNPLGTKGGTTAGSVYTVTLGLGTDFAVALVDDSGTALPGAILNIA